MANYRLTIKAAKEIENIYVYSILHFGIQKAQEYLNGLHDCFVFLANNAGWGRDYGFVKSGLLRYEYRSHAVYYQKIESGVLIIRVLGGRQDPARHIIS